MHLCSRTPSLWRQHGSINWFWDDPTRSTDSMVEVRQFLEWGRKSIPAPPEGRAPGKVRVSSFLPPTRRLPSLPTGIVRRIWRGAFEAIRSAD
jgi:hypothetical protein